MKRAAVLKVLNLILGALALSQVLTGVLHDLLPKRVFETVHEAGGLAFAVSALLHLGLNWSWVKANYFSGNTAAGG